MDKCDVYLPLSNLFFGDIMLPDYSIASAMRRAAVMRKVEFGILIFVEAVDGSGQNAGRDEACSTELALGIY